MFGFSIFTHIWIFGHAETVPRYISRFQFRHFEKSTFLKYVGNVDSKCTFVTGFRSPTRVRGVGAACGASATSEKTRPGFLEHVSYVCLSFLTISGSGTRGDLRSVRGGNQEQG